MVRTLQKHQTTCSLFFDFVVLLFLQHFSSLALSVNEALNKMQGYWHSCTNYLILVSSFKFNWQKKCILENKTLKKTKMLKNYLGVYNVLFGI